MVRFGRNPRNLRLGAALGAIALLAGCGGGGGPASTPAPRPSPTPSPSPSPSPTPTPTAAFNTAEFRRSDGPEFHNAVSAWSVGATGQSEIIAVIDTGIDSDSPEFAGRIHPDSRDVASNRAIDGDDDHGTQVAMVAAAARDDTGVLGIAFNATVLALRADDPGSCTAGANPDGTSGCFFFDDDIAVGIDQAIASGATVINLSLGGGAPLPVLTSAVQRAAAAGIVVVVSAGNDGDGSNPDIPPDQPDPFASSLVQAGNGNVIIVGSVDENGVISDFSNRAGSFATSFITARGQGICCVYQNGQLLIETDSNGNQFVTIVSGTSFSAPQVSGAVALLAQAFPNLTAAQIVAILLETALDAGTPGIDAIYGTGILDIAAAFAPQGTTTLAGSTSQMPIGDDTALGSSAMGDALGQAAISTVLLDSYRRAYSYSFASRFRGAQLRQALSPALDIRGRQVSGESGGLAMAFTLDDRGPQGEYRWNRQLSLTSEEAEGARVLAARMAFAVDPDTQLGFAYGQNGDGLVGQLQGQSRPAFLIADAARGDTGFLRSADISMALRRRIGAWGLTLSAEQGEAWLGTFRQASDIIGPKRENHALRSFSLATDRSFGPFEAVLGLTWMNEDRTVLGGYFHESFGARGADTLFVDAGAALHLAPDWRLGFDLRRGHTRARRSSVIAPGSDFASNGWSFDIQHQGIWQRNDSLGLRLSQPLRVSHGGLMLDLPVSYDYATESATFGVVPLSLAPTGREIMGELSWHGMLFDGRAAASLFYRNQPGHYADAPADTGVALRWSREF